MTEEPSAQPIEPEAETEPKTVSMGIRFTKADLDVIDAVRGERTKTQYAHDAVVMWSALERLLAPYLPTMAIDPKGRTAPLLICDALEFYLQPVTNPPTWNVRKGTETIEQLKDLNELAKLFVDPAEADKYRGNSTLAEFVSESVTAQLKVAKMLETEKKKRAVVLKHDCGEKYDVLHSGNDVFLTCVKCHKSEKLTKEAYEQWLTEAAKA